MRFLLLPLSLIFIFISWLRNLFFDLGILSQTSVGKPVICVGNLTTGGTGKTPWVQLLSGFFDRENIKNVIISRGYTGNFSGVLEVDAAMDPRQCGDEPLWLKKNTNADVFVGKSRVEAAQKALQEKDYDCLILDDGYQHRYLNRHMNLVLLDASAPSHHYSMLPVGRMREPFSALKRASLVVINKCNYADPKQTQSLRKKALKWVSEDSVFLSDFVFDHWEPIIDEVKQSLEVNSVSLSCGVGNPKAFSKTVEEQGIQPVESFIYPDHYYWKTHDIEKMTYKMKQKGSFDLVITEKDAVKLIRYRKHFQEMKIQLWVCKMKVQIRENESTFFAKIRASLV